MTSERIVVPFNEAGRRCYEVLTEIALRRLYSAREAVAAYIKGSMPNAKTFDENAMKDGKYWANLALPSGKRRTLTYDYRTKVVELI